MTTPFPGMDPYLEGHLWPDVHLGLSFLIKDQITSRVSDQYVVRNATYTVEDTSPESDIGIMYPDVELLHREQKVKESMIGSTYQTDDVGIVTPPTITLAQAFPIEVRVPFVEIRDSKDNRLITAIEILSPVNKRAPGLETYRKKRLRLHQAGVHLLEIDLLRRGERPFKHPYLPKTHYLALLTRAGASDAEIWAFNVQDPLPVLPVPLKNPDPDLPLPLRQALEDIYARSRYHLSINYKEAPPPPPLSKKEWEWVRNLPGI